MPVSPAPSLTFPYAPCAPGRWTVAAVLTSAPCGRLPRARAANGLPHSTPAPAGGLPRALPWAPARPCPGTPGAAPGPEPLGTRTGTALGVVSSDHVSRGRPRRHPSYGLRRPSATCLVPRGSPQTPGRGCRQALLGLGPQVGSPRSRRPTSPMLEGSQGCSVRARTGCSLPCSRHAHRPNRAIDGMGPTPSETQPCRLLPQRPALSIIHFSLRH